MLPRQEWSGEGRPATAGCTLLWYTGCVLTLGLAPLHYKEIQDARTTNRPANRNSRRSLLGEVRLDRQQKEWDRLVILLSVIGATSVSALATPPPFGSPNLHLVASAFYTLSFGLSFEGLFLILYLSTLMGSPSMGTTRRIAAEPSPFQGKTGPVAVVTALPMAVAIYSSLSLMAGILAMTVVSDDGGNPGDHALVFRIVVLLSLLLIPVCAVCAVVACKASTEVSEAESTRQPVRQGRVGESVTERVDGVAEIV